LGFITDDILLFYEGTRRDALNLKEVLDLYYTATGMEINLEKSTLSFYEVSEEDCRVLSYLFPYQQIDFNLGLKYLGFVLKPNAYGIKDWSWLIEKVEKRLSI